MNNHKFHYYRVWYGDGNDRRELTTFPPRAGLIKAVDIDHAIKQVLQVYVGKEHQWAWEDTGEGDDTIAFLEYTLGRKHSCEDDLPVHYLAIEEV